MSVEAPDDVRPKTTTAKSAPVRVIARKDSTVPDGVSFDLHSTWKKSKDRLEFDKNKDKMKKNEPYLVEFSLEDPEGIGLRFVQPKEEAMWVSQGIQGQDPPCPTSVCHNTRFEAVSVTDTTLTVNNPDEHIENFSFTLRFRKPGEKPGDPETIVPYDPITENKDGGN